MKTAEDIIKRIDFQLLKEQKSVLAELIEKSLDGNEEKRLQGLYNLIDDIQDFAVDVLGKNEKEVFHLFNDKNDILIEVGMTVDVDDTPDNLDFRGTVDSFKGKYVVVEDMEGNAFCMDSKDIEIVVEEPEKSCKWDVPISRVGYSGRVQEIRVDEPITEEEAVNLAIDEAGGESFSEHTSEYSAPDGAIKL